MVNLIIYVFNFHVILLQNNNFILQLDIKI